MECKFCTTHINLQPRYSDGGSYYKCNFCGCEVYYDVNKMIDAINFWTKDKKYFLQVNYQANETRLYFYGSYIEQMFTAPNILANTPETAQTKIKTLLSFL